MKRSIFITLLTTAMVASITACSGSTSTSETVKSIESESIKEEAPSDKREAEQEIVEAPQFSEPGGFYDEAISLEITSPDGYEIRYTTDATSPTVSMLTYKLPLTIENTDSKPNYISSRCDITLESYTAPMYQVPKCTIVRAVCVSPEGAVSNETMATYFIGRTEEYYANMGTISLITDEKNLFDSTEGIFVTGSMYEEWKSSSSYDKDADPFDPTIPVNYRMKGRDWERPATIQVYKNGRMRFEQAIGIRVSGNYSRGYAQKSLNLYARKQYSKGEMEYDFFDGSCLDMNGEPIKVFNTVNIRNGGNGYAGVRFRDELSQELMGQTNLSVQAKQSYILYINGEFWGMYSMRDKQNKHYVSSHFGVDKDNVTIIKCGELEDGSEKIMEEFREFYAWALQADLSDSENYKRFAETIDLDGFIDLFVGESYVCNLDFGANNWSIWRVNELDDTTCGDGKWRFLVYDIDYSLGLDGVAQTAYDFDYLNQMLNFSEGISDFDTEDLAPSVLFYKLITVNEKFRERFYSRYIDLMDTVYAYENVLPVIDRIVEQQEAACLDTLRRFSIISDYEDEVYNIKEFFRCRREYALESLERFCS